MDTCSVVYRPVENRKNADCAPPLNLDRCYQPDSVDAHLSGGVWHFGLAHVGPIRNLGLVGRFVLSGLRGS